MQICYVNGAAASIDTDSPSSDSESCPKLSKPLKHSNQSLNLYATNNDLTAQPNPYNSRPLSMKKMSTFEKGNHIH